MILVSAEIKADLTCDEIRRLIRDSRGSYQLPAPVNRLDYGLNCSNNPYPLLEVQALSGQRAAEAPHIGSTEILVSEEYFDIICRYPVVTFHLYYPNSVSCVAPCLGLTLLSSTSVALGSLNRSETSLDMVICAWLLGLLHNTGEN